MDGGHVHVGGTARAFSRHFNHLLQTLFDPFEAVVEVKRPAFFEGDFDLNGGQARGDPAARDGLDQSHPGIGAKERGRDMAVADIEKWSGE